MWLEHGHSVPGGWRELSPVCQVGEFMEWSRASWAVGAESWPCHLASGWPQITIYFLPQFSPLGSDDMVAQISYTCEM